ncbi:phosphoglycolate phosphatase [Paracoccus caeni]|uniref:Phosphoglycolate phosphatase n=1 Tax=Paracoccus caeni TaxID=657651 RepID=A0A934VZR1_9RHOB|nr:phosphoglycolate phosphatase [Paracoccus caeni]MBK4217292.1 phosphoglycolate phosphatase [Paracoccus caeni]
MNVCMAPCPVVFDLDGTLIDSAPDIHASVNATLQQFQLDPLTLDQVRSFIGGGVEVLWQKIIAALQLQPSMQADLIAAFMNRYHDATGLTRLYPGVREALSVLADRGHPLGICTNKPAAVTATILDHFGIRDLFGVIVGGDTLPQKKPDPAPLRKALQDLGAHPTAPQAIYVGDSEFDAACAEAVPVPFLLFRLGYRQTPEEQLTHRAAFNEFSELPELIATFAEA